MRRDITEDIDVMENLKLKTISFDLIQLKKHRKQHSKRICMEESSISSIFRHSNRAMSASSQAKKKLFFLKIESDIQMKFANF
jgi:hypothetical protein